MAIYSELSKLGRVKLPNNTEYALIDVDGRAMLAPNWSNTSAYVIGDHVIHGDNLYRANSNISAPASGSTNTWDATKWDNCTVDTEIKRIEGILTGGIHYAGKTTTALYDGSTKTSIVINSASHTALSGELVILDLANVASNYATNTAYSAPDSTSGTATYIKNSGVYYIVESAISASENTSFSAIESKLSLVSSNPEFLFDGTVWNVLGSIDDGLGALAWKDTASGTYIKPTGSGSVTVKEYAPDTSKLVTTSIYGVGGTQSVSLMSAGTAVDVAKAGTAVVYGTADVGAATVYGTANKASTATTVGNANVGTAVTYGNANVGSEVTYGNANVGSEVTVATAAENEVVYGTADVGTAVTYGTANPGTAVTGVAKVEMDGNSAKSRTFTTEGIKASVSGDCLSFSSASTDSVIGVQSSGVSITPAVASSTTLTPAKAADTTRKIRGVGGTTGITPAVTSTTKIKGAVASTTTLTPAVASTTSIYGAVDAPNTQTLTPATAAPSTQKIIPAVSNGTITPWSKTGDYTVATKASNPTTVATGSVDGNGSGATVATGISSSDASKTVTVGTTTDTVTVK